MKSTYYSLAVLTGWLHLSLVLGQIVRYTQDGGQISYSFHIPDTTASTGNGPIFFQIQSPSNLQWVGLGEGSQMSGANILVIYASSNGNVTLSPRSGEGHFEPVPNPSARVSLLGGSGISNGVMTANVRCDSCISWSGGQEDVTSASSPWIWAARYGQPLDSDSASESISQHDINGQFTVDLSLAIGKSSENPFVDESSTSTGTSTGTGTSTSSSSNTSPKYTTVITGSANRVLNAFEMKRAAHGIIMSIIFVILLPIAALSLHIVPSSKTVMFIHAPLQLFALAAAVAGLGLGISLALEIDEYSSYHPIIGTIVVSSLVLFQPLMGFLQHAHYRETGTKSIFAYMHRWLGRIMITLGVINGGLGFHFAGLGLPGVPTAGAIAYGVLAGIMASLYIIVLLFSSRRARRNSQNEVGALKHGLENAQLHPRVPEEQD